MSKDLSLHARRVVDNVLTAQSDTRRQARAEELLHEIRDGALEEAARAAGDAQLPEGYQWGEEATEHFNFGKARAAAAIRALKGAG